MSFPSSLSSTRPYYHLTSSPSITHFLCLVAPIPLPFHSIHTSLSSPTPDTSHLPAHCPPLFLPAPLGCPSPGRRVPFIVDLSHVLSAPSLTCIVIRGGGRRPVMPRIPHRSKPPTHTILTGTWELMEEEVVMLWSIFTYCSQRRHQPRICKRRRACGR